MNWLFLLVTTFVFQIEIGAITHSAKDKDELNLNTIQNGPQYQDQRKMNQKEETIKDGIENATQEKRTFFQPQPDRKGSFYPSGPNFAVGTSINVGNAGYTPNYHTSGNGYSYGGPDYPPINYPTGQSTGPNIPQGESSFSERNHFGQHHPSFGYGVPNPGGSAYGVPSVHGSGGGFTIPSGHSSGGGFSIPSIGHSSGGAFGIPSMGHSGGGYGLTPQHSGSGAQHPLKGLIIPIAGFALLGAAAVLAKSHPVLLQLGVIHGRKKRNVYPVNPFTTPEDGLKSGI